MADGEAALAAARRQPPDLVLTDVMMPRLDGFGLLRELRADPRTRDVPVIMLSARAGEESRVEGMEAGADDYLVKPFSARELLARVGAHLQMARMRREAAEALREADRRKDEFLAMLAHELREPLAPLRNMLEVLKRADGRRRPDRSRPAPPMERQLGQLVRLVDDLLDVSRITRNKLELRKERVELASVIHQARRDLPPAGRGPASTRSPWPCRRSRSTCTPTRCGWPRCSTTCSTTPASTPSRGGRIWLTAERQARRRAW